MSQETKIVAWDLSVSGTEKPSQQEMHKSKNKKNQKYIVRARPTVLLKSKDIATITLKVK